MVLPFLVVLFRHQLFQCFLNLLFPRFGYLTVYLLQFVNSVLRYALCFATDDRVHICIGPYTRCRFCNLFRFVYNIHTLGQAASRVISLCYKRLNRMHLANANGMKA